MKIEKLEANIFLNGSKTFHELCKGKTVLSLDETSSSQIWGADGGLELTVNGFYTIFNSNEFHHLIQVVNFLTLSICLARKVTLPSTLLFFDYPESNKIFQTLAIDGSSYLEVEFKDDENVYLSYYVSDKISTSRYNRSFSSFSIKKDLWVSEISNSLNDFFSVFNRICSSDENSSEIHFNYIKMWEYILVEINES